MRRTTPAAFEARAKVMKALAHPSRLFIVDALARRELCVRELTDMIGAHMSTVSKHLSVLKNAGIVAPRKRGSQVYYTLAMTCAPSFLECAEAAITAVAKSHAEQAKLCR